MKCYICGGMCSSEVVQMQYTYWKCSTCFTSQVRPQPSSEVLKLYYDTFHLSNALGGVYDEVEERMQADFSEKVKEVKKYFTKGKPNLLDVGCGKGFFVKAALNQDITAEGIDLSVSGVSHAVNILGVQAKVGTIESCLTDDWRGKFDAVTFWATIEHLADPAATLVAIHECLQPGGMLFVDTGLGNGKFEKYLAGFNQWYSTPEHLFVFSEMGLLKLLKNAGFEIVHVNKNFERSLGRRWLKMIRYILICGISGLLLRPLLGKYSFEKMRREAKWALGNLITIVATKRIS